MYLWHWHAFILTLTKIIPPLHVSLTVWSTVFPIILVTFPSAYLGTNFLQHGILADNRSYKVICLVESLGRETNGTGKTSTSEMRNNYINITVDKH